MTTDEILAGPAVERANPAFHPMTEAEARHFLRGINAKMAKKNRGPVMRRIADAGVGNLSPEARNLYRAYAATYGA